MTYLHSGYEFDTRLLGGEFSYQKGSLLMFGGSCIDSITGCERGSNSLYLLSLDTKKWFPLEGRTSGQPPPQTFGHTAIVRGDNVFIIGGSVVVLKSNSLSLSVGGEHTS